MPKRTKHLKQDQSAAGQRYNIKGGIHANNVVMGDQTNIVNQTQQNFVSPKTSEEFLIELTRVREEIKTLKNQPGLPPPVFEAIQTVEAQVLDAAEEVQQPEPSAQSIRDTLKEAKETMDLIKGSIQSAVGLGLTLGMLADLALRLFAR
jgi:hypothetical protein